MKAEAALTYGNLTFVAELPARRLAGSEKPFFGAPDLQQLERAAALWLIEHGVAAPETIRALRAAAGLSQSQLAELLSTSKAVVSRWENGHASFDVGTWQTVADLALDAIHGRDDTLRRLQAVRTHAADRQPQRVTLSIRRAG